ncbi:MAG: hypothetical protein CUN56_09680 [Phototrophicales bacterium]|nr:MAG: hypothetical protein CUN56_09680 [Phototrophicales bacterium]RMG74597.1 MAG: hypothetical protein D6711_08475 [Chloroflexota bacterium]
MSLGIFVMLVIILITLLVVGAVMYFGSQHDPHTNVRSVESSRAVQTLIEQQRRAAQKLALQQPKKNEEETV